LIVAIFVDFHSSEYLKLCEHQNLFDRSEPNKFFIEISVIPLDQGFPMYRMSMRKDTNLT
jgi:hypothetical protein